MTFDLGTTLKEMLGAARDSLGKDWTKVQKVMQRVLQDEKQALESIAAARINGEIDDKELAGQLTDEKEALAAGLDMVEAVKKASLQRAVDAALNVFKKALQKAL